MRVRTGLLAVAAIASLAVAAVRIAGAAHQTHTRSAFTAEVFVTSPALAAAAFRRLHTPPGYREMPCRTAQPDRRCYSRPQSLLLSDARMTRLLKNLGVKPEPLGGAGAIGCTRPKHHRPPQPAFQACNAVGVVGKERLTVSATSQLIAGPTWIHTTNHAYSGALHPSEIQVDVIGHAFHTGEIAPF
jgi:hypothetical protein